MRHICVEMREEHVSSARRTGSCPYSRLCSVDGRCSMYIASANASCVTIPILDQPSVFMTHSVTLAAAAAVCVNPVTSHRY